MEKIALLIVINVIAYLQLSNINVIGAELQEPSSTPRSFSVVIPLENPSNESSIAELSRLADEGNPEACCVLGKKYEEGDGVEKNISLARKLYEQAAEAGSSEGMYRLGNWQEKYSWVAFFFPSSSRQWYRKAAEAGHKEAQYRLAMRVLAPLRPSEQENEGTRWLRAAAQQGLLQAQFTLAHYVPTEEEGFSILLNIAEQTSKDTEDHDTIVEAQYRVGRSYAKGDCVAQDTSTAIYWLNRAATAGHHKAKIKLGELAEKGAGGLSAQLAVELYEKVVVDAARIGDTKTRSLLRRLVLIYQEGREGIAPDLVKEIHYLRQIHKLDRDKKLSNHQDRDLLYRLGCLLEAQPGEDNVQEIFSCFQKFHRAFSDTVDRSDLELKLGKMCEEGRGTQQDDDQAAFYYKIAVKKGNAEAAERLGRLHSQGRGLTWFEKMGAKLAQLVK